jgi:hypothetical protein
MLNELSVVGKLLYQVVPVLCCLDTDDKNVKMTELQNSRFRALAKTRTHAQAQQSPAKGVLTCINHEGSERGQWPKVSQRCFLPLLFTAKECMLSPGQAWPPGAAPRIEPFIRPRLQGGTHRARSTKPNSSSPDWGKRRLKPPSRAFPSAVISREPRSAASSLHTFHRFIRTAPFLIHQAACGAANQGPPRGAATRANPAVATRTQFERVRGRRREATISHQHCVWLLTLEPRSEIGIGRAAL